MKHFGLIITLIRIVVAVLFAANIIFMSNLYHSIKKRYLDDVAQSLRRADQIEIVDRIIEAGLGDENGIVQIQLGLQKSDIDGAATVEELRDREYSQGYRRVDRQVISVITNYLHYNYRKQLGKPDIGKIEEAFRRDLYFSGYFPKTVLVFSADAAFECSSDLWMFDYSIDGNLTYVACISPLTKDIMREMGGVIAVSVLLALVLTFGFWYLLCIIRRQRTIEEMREDFTNNMTHELKTPIAIAYAANDSLLQFPDPANEERTKKYLRASLEQLTKLTMLVESILAMSMEKRKNLAMAKERILLKPFLASVIEQHKLKADKPCRIVLVCAEEAIVNADPTHFSNVMSNLIENSIKHSGDSVSIMIRADNYSVSVSDNGIGIPEKSLPEIFKRFYRVPSGNRSDIRGNGIGLFYVKSIVEKHGWSISVASKPGKGSRFTIKFTEDERKDTVGGR